MGDSDRLRTAAAAVIVKLWEMEPVTPDDRRTSTEIRKMTDASGSPIAKPYWNALADMLDILNEPVAEPPGCTWPMGDCSCPGGVMPAAHTCMCEGSFSGPQAKHSEERCEDGDGGIWVRTGAFKRPPMVQQQVAALSEPLTEAQRKMGLDERGARYLKQPVWSEDWD